jgi:tRNA nucleotidyltransferase (CCA-adding enzyme)
MMHDPVVEGLQVYVVGGAVRDALLQLEAGDQDWVVVGASPEEMARRGFVPVGGEFPVFLHPQTKEEYALARTERKSGRGYKGFTFYTGTDVTLEEDLKRRDLTVNAIARAVSGELFDPLDGVKDIHAHVLRHVGPAFEEDPVRILRLARFTARFVDFSIAPETLELCRKMVAQGEVDALVPERVWQELSRGLLCQQPSRMIRVLVECGASARVMPGWGDSVLVDGAIDRAAQMNLSLAARFALLCLDTQDAYSLAKHLRAPTECSDMSRLLPVVLKALGSANMLPEHVLALFEQCDAIRKPERFIELLRTAQTVAEVLVANWQQWLDAARSIDAGSAARHAPSPQQIKAYVRAARLLALNNIMLQDCRDERLP